MKNDFIWDDWKSKHLNKHFEPVDPLYFYQDIFGDGFLQEEGKEHYGDKKTNGIAVELEPNPNNSKKPIVKRYTICDGLDTIDELLEHENFIIISPISYVGKARTSENARYLHALAIDVDGMTDDEHMRDLIYQLDGYGPSRRIPLPTYIVNSGNGLHYYYVFEKPIPLFENTAKELQNYKDRLTKYIWNKFVTTLSEKVQIESLFQGFRMAGGVTKTGRRTCVFKSGKKVSIEYLNEFVPDENKIKHATYYKELTVSKAKELYPEWYQRRVVEKKPKGHWTTKRDVYDWWLRRIKNEKKEGHRYFCIMCLAVYAKKAGITYDELYDDAMALVEDFDAITERDGNAFTEEDVLEALEMYNDNFYTFPIETIKNISDIDIQKNIRNGRKQSVHLERARAVQKIDYPDGGWRKNNGRKSKKDIIQNWRKSNPEKTQRECAKETGITIRTVNKWWDGKSPLEIVYEWRINNIEGTQYRCQKETGLDKKTIRKWWNEDISLHLPLGPNKDKLKKKFKPSMSNPAIIDFVKNSVLPNMVVPEGKVPYLLSGHKIGKQIPKTDRTTMVPNVVEVQAINSAFDHSKDVIKDENGNTSVYTYYNELNPTAKRDDALWEEFKKEASKVFDNQEEEHIPDVLLLLKDILDLGIIDEKYYETWKEKVITMDDGTGVLYVRMDNE